MNIDDELSKLAGNPRLASVLKASLERLSKGTAGPELAEMARDALAGRSSLRQVGQSPAYAEQFTAAAGGFKEWLDQLSPEEREELETKVREEFGKNAS